MMTLDHIERLERFRQRWLQSERSMAIVAEKEYAEALVGCGKQLLAAARRGVEADQAEAQTKNQP